MFYSSLVTLHIIFAGIWLSNFLVDLFLRKYLTSSNRILDIYLKIINLLSSFSAVGILTTGILLVLNSGYGFFRMTDNHWLATKQILMVVLLVVIGAFVIPTAKKLRSSLSNSDSILNSEESKIYLKKLLFYNNIINTIVILNFLFAITHRYFG
ncbi:MAG: hypothetical protein AB1695_08845 [Stygiobacter sp.]|jgi:uncharacterized membrane protein SirB2|uniref:Copper resistance protein D domain-containing protein n=1 Tax=Stygiobacter electus TaxID=3032292 RepID=A0AAE3TE65_9BACT|nr:hypothetical protein [Stygiobacter electus]MDF1611943.1 hypothetical protein [Stygiobacter electus]